MYEIKKMQEQRNISTKENIKALEQEPCEDCVSRQAAQSKIKSICDKYGLSYEDGERKVATGGSAYALGHAFDDLPSVTQQETYVNIPFLLHKEFGCPLDECQKAYNVAIDYLRSQGKVKG
jgi:hypothetical protein